MQVIAVPHTLFLILTIAVVISVVVQGAVFLGLFLVARTALAKAEKIANDASARALPIITHTRTIVEDLTPKIKIIAANLVEISTTLKDQTQHVNSTVGDVVDKTRHQAERVDEMVSAILNSVTHAGATIQAGVKKPVRQVNGLFNAVKTSFERFTKPKVGTRQTGAGKATTVSNTYPAGAAPVDYQVPVTHP